MTLDFTKYHGHGNDFILLDNRQDLIHLTTEQIQQLCHRHFGIGSDGLILIENQNDSDFNMNFYNPDGSQSFCGNGSRCSLHFARSLGIIENKAKFLAIDGFHNGTIEGEKTGISLNDVGEIEIGEDYFYLNTGSPHYVKIVNNLDKIDVFTEGRIIRYNDRFKEHGTNVNFVEINNGKVMSRVYERGVENETFSSGTGTTAVALSAFLYMKSSHEKIIVSTKGGELEVSFNYLGNNHFSNIWLKGEVIRVFSGQLNL